MEKRKAFTLIELLVVIAIIGLLLSILIPALTYVKEQATAILCQANINGLGKAWILYIEENNAFLVGGSTYNSTRYRWCERPLVSTAPVPLPDNVDPANYQATGAAEDHESRLRGIRAGKLFVYTENEKLYHCPNDKNWVKQQDPYKVYRTYAITGQMNGEDFRGDSNPPGQVSIPGGGTRTFKMARKLNDVFSPAMKHVFIEEDVVDSPVHTPQDHNLGGFVLMANSVWWRWWDIPAYYHNDRSTIGFADGHGEKHTWKDPRTLALMKHVRGTPGQPSNDQQDNEDMLYMNMGYFPGR